MARGEMSPFLTAGGEHGRKGITNGGIVWYHELARILLTLYHVTEAVERIIPREMREPGKRKMNSGNARPFGESENLSVHNGAHDASTVDGMVGKEFPWGDTVISKSGWREVSVCFGRGNDMKKNELFSSVRGAERILIMDDEESILKTTSRLLQKFGYDVEMTRNGTEMLDSFRKAREKGSPFHAVIMDLTVPGGMGGKESIRKLLEIDPKVKAMVTSGYSNDPVMADFRDYGFSAVVSKPYKIEDLNRTLREMIETVE